MPFIDRLVQPFERPHEQEMWDALVRELSQSLHDEDAYLLGNLLVQGKELDALLVRRRSITVIELKSYRGEIHFSENGDWYADDVVVRGGNQTNPFQQVRSNKFAVLDRLRAATATANGGLPNRNWQISGIVVFEAPSKFSESLPSPIRPWFHIADLQRVGEHVRSISSTIDLTSAEISLCVHALGGTAFRPQRISILYLKQSDFNAAIRQTRGRGGPGMIAANLFDRFPRIIQEGRDPFENLPSAARHEIQNLRIFSLGEYRLAAVQFGKIYCLGTIGRNDEVEAWIEANKGFEFVVDPETKKIQTTKVRATLDHLTTHTTGEAQPYLSQVVGVDLPALGISKFVAKILSAINEDTDAMEVEEVLEAVINPDDRSFLIEVFELLRVGDRAGAQARIDLRIGIAAPAEAMPETLAAAIGSIENCDSIIDLATLDEEEWARIFEPGKFQEWMVFLHPGQKRVVEEDFTKPAVLTGVSGSGKTCVLVHRARRMAWKYSNHSVIVLTLNRSLAVLISNLLQRVCSSVELPRVDVKSFHDYLAELMTQVGGEQFLINYGVRANHREAVAELIQHLPSGGFETLFRPLDERDLRTRFRMFITDMSGDVRIDYYELERYLTPKDPNLDVARYLYEELELIRSAFSCADGYYDYLGAYEREGRMVPLDKQHRGRVLNVLHAWEEFQLENRFFDHMGLCQAALLAFDSDGLPHNFRHRCVLVDEFQDFSTIDFRILRKIPLDGENGLFIAGDFAQKLYAKELDFAKVGMGTGSRDLRSIRKNYRNSKQILLAGDRLLRQWPPVIGRDSELAILNPELADRESAKPIALSCQDPVAQAWSEAAHWLSQGHVAFSVCIASSDTDHLPVETILRERPAGIEADLLTGDYMLKPSRVIVSDIASIKGFEFSLIIVLGLEEGLYPPKGRQVNEQWRDAMRLYVAITRGRDEVRFLYSGRPSPFLTAMGETVSWQIADEVSASSVSRGDSEDEVVGTSIVYSSPEPQKATSDDLLGQSEQPLPEFGIDSFDSTLLSRSRFDEPFVETLNGFPVAVVPAGMNEFSLASFLGKDQTEIALQIQNRHNHFIPPTAALARHILEDVLRRYGYLVDFRG